MLKFESTSNGGKKAEFFFSNFLPFQPLIAPVPSCLRPVAGIKFEKSSFNG